MSPTFYFISSKCTIAFLFDRIDKQNIFYKFFHHHSILFLYDESNDLGKSYTMYLDDPHCKNSTIPFADNGHETLFLNYKTIIISGQKYFCLGRDICP